MKSKSEYRLLLFTKHVSILNVSGTERLNKHVESLSGNEVQFLFSMNFI